LISAGSLVQLQSRPPLSVNDFAETTQRGADEPAGVIWPVL